MHKNGHLTDRVKEYIKLAYFQQKEIAVKLCVSPATVRSMTRIITRQLKTTSLPAAAHKAIEMGEIEFDELVVPERKI